MGKGRRNRGNLMFKKVKRPCCMPTHLSEVEALHIAKNAYLRNWSNSAYIRELVIKDMQQQEDDLNLRAAATGIERERFELFEHTERKKHGQQKSPN